MKLQQETIILNEKRNVTLTVYVQEAEGEFLLLTLVLKNRREVIVEGYR